MKWCPLVYEYLPNFCYTCGLIGHIDRICEVQLKKGEAQRFSRSLRIIPEKKKYGDFNRGLSGEQRYQLPWRSSRGRGSGGSGSGGSGSLRGSDSDNWHKGPSMVEKGLPIGEESKVTSPEKVPKTQNQARGPKKALTFENVSAKLGKINVEVGSQNLVEEKEKKTDVLHGDVNNTM